ncbi:MAG: hypothetical protein ABJL67_08085 [Sulfitobacter sp.]
MLSKINIDRFAYLAPAPVNKRPYVLPFNLFSNSASPHVVFEITIAGMISLTPATRRTITSTGMLFASRGRFSAKRSALVILRAKHFNPSAIVVRAIFGALPHGFGHDFVELCGQMNGVPEYVRIWVIADSGGGVSFEACLTRETIVGANGTLLLASGGTITLKCADGWEHQAREERRVLREFHSDFGAGDSWVYNLDGDAHSTSLVENWQPQYGGARSVDSEFGIMMVGSG